MIIFFYSFIFVKFQTDKNIVKGRHAGAHFDLSCQNWERNQNKDFRSYVFKIRNSVHSFPYLFLFRRMKQRDLENEAFKSSRLLQYQQYGTYDSNRGNISGRPGLSNSTPMTLHHLAKSSIT